MARYNESTIPEDLSSYNLEFMVDSSQFIDDQHIYQSQQVITDPISWPQHPANMNNQMLEQQTASNTPYELQQIDSTLWQYDDEQLLDSRGMTSPSHGRAEETVIDPRLRSIPHHEFNEPSTGSTSSYREVPSREQARQAPSQVFVIPFTDQDHQAESFPDSNNMLCDFPGIAFRSFLPKDAAKPASTSRNPYESIQGTRRVQKSVMRKHVLRQGPTQPQAYGSFPNIVSGEPEQSSTNSTLYASGLSRFTTPDVG